MDVIVTGVGRHPVSLNNCSMEYRYLKGWLDKHGPLLINSVVSSIRKQRDSLFWEFKGKSSVLQIVLNSSDPFLFLTTKDNLPSKEGKGLDQYNHHLNHCRINNIAIDDQDRIITLSAEKIDIYNQPVSYRLIIELIPHRENIILTKMDDGREQIIECWKYVTLAAKSTRQILPGAVYESPQRVNTEDYSQTPAYLQMVSYPLYLKDLVKNPKLISEEIAHKQYQDINQLFQDYYYTCLSPLREKKEQDSLVKKLLKERDRKIKKIQKLRAEYDDSAQWETYKKYAELLKVNMHNIKKGDSSVIVTDYYSTDNREITIPLNREISPQENMRYLFKKYRKGRSGREAIKSQIERTEEEMEELERSIFDIEMGNVDITSMSRGAEAKISGKKKDRIDRYRRLKINQDWEIFVGRTARENDDLTCKYAQPDDWWFHCRIFHGAHVVLRNYTKSEISSELIRLCSRLAAYFSKAKNSENVPVDYTQIRYVTKPRNSPPGFVVYKHQKTLYVNPISFRDAAQIIAKTFG